jgi:hypothetical protein
MSSSSQSDSSQAREHIVASDAEKRRLSTLCRSKSNRALAGM